LERIYDVGGLSGDNVTFKFCVTTDCQLAGRLSGCRVVGLSGWLSQGMSKWVGGSGGVDIRVTRLDQIEVCRARECYQSSCRWSDRERYECEWSGKFVKGVDWLVGGF